MTDFAIISAEQYATERAICDAANAYADSVMCGPDGKRIRNFMTAEEAAAPVYAACNNDMRGRVEQYELKTNPPESFVAYIGADDRGPLITVWTGLPLGRASVTSKWRRAYTPMLQYVAWMAGREYTGRGQGEGMAIVLRETAASKAKRESGK